MNSSLQKLVKILSVKDFKYLNKEFVFENLKLLKQKDAYPYEYMDSFKKINEEKLCDKKCFYSSVKDGTTGDNGEKSNDHISDEDYLTSKNIWNEFCLKNMGHYHDHYLKKDVFLLADVFEKFIDPCLKFYKLDSCHYFNSRGLSWDAMLKMAGVKLEKTSDIDMYLFIEKRLRGGTSYVARRYSEGNNKYVKDYDPTKPSRFISYLDMNNLYGYLLSICVAMSGYLPCGGFRWLQNVDNFDVNLYNSSRITCSYL